MNLWARLRNWYVDQHFESGFLGVSLSARVARRLGRFWLDHWKWICTTALAALAIVLTVWYRR